jgi:hypothetical protein
MPNKKRGLEKIGESERWSKGDSASSAQVFKKPNGSIGISVKLGRKTSTDYIASGKTTWIDKNLDLPDWLNWLIRTLKKMYYRVFGKTLVIDEEVESLKAKMEGLTQELAITKEKLRVAEEKDAERQRIHDLALKSIEYLDSYTEILTNFENTIKESYEKQVGKEEKIKEDILGNPWILGLECKVEAKNIDLDTQTEIDLHVITKYGQHKIFEIKSPNLKPFIRYKNDDKKRLVMGPELSNGLSELIVYMRKADVYSVIQEEGTVGISKPSGVLIIGYKLDGEQLKMLNQFNFHLRPHIQILTYDDLLNNAKQEIKLIEYIKKEAENKLKG